MFSSRWLQTSSSSSQNPTQLFPTFDPSDGFNDLFNVIRLAPGDNGNDPVLIPCTGAGKRTPEANKRRDSHRKISTAQGLRDRRMRLSQDVAQKFFDLQDVLGFDRPSETVDWLLTKSKYAIESLSTPCPFPCPCSPCGGSRSQTTKAESSTSECEVKGPRKSSTTVRRSPRVNGTRKSIVSANPVLQKELRAKARERARKRTTEKGMLKTSTATRVEEDQTLLLEHYGDPSLEMMITSMLNNGSSLGYTTTASTSASNNTTNINVDSINLCQEYYPNLLPQWD
ncbi:hypothetical protein ZOSMA_220G00160 [Zostera marina]|uniref:Uncharacterized protein n=1 Tax=Zostera marina TaxID=29655 RepID=A0A0K9PJL6_ZOSMR|nr:hypothetical protein ZOSMA_220G00160 [Zostera marina]